MSTLLQRLFFWNFAERRNKRALRSLFDLVKKINALEPEMKALSDEALAGKTVEFQKDLAEGKTLDDILIPAFAVVRETSWRVLGMRPFDVQLLGGIALHKGMIAEMKTGEGKTLVATAPVYLNALNGQGVHVITVNDYLAQRDSTHMAKLYEFLGLSVGCVINSISPDQRKRAYDCDITYGTNNEFGFDYLRDNMKFSRQDRVQRGHVFAIVDEVDSILIDEARTPLIISGAADDASDLYTTIDYIVRQAVAEDYEKEEKTKSIAFTDTGYQHMERLVKQAGLIKGEQLFQPANLMIVHHLNQALKALHMFHRDVDYIVKDDKVMIIDEFTGRIMVGRRYSDGLHQALEAKERVEIESENQTLASITFQNYFRLYKKLSGMTGTASTEAAEFQEIYRLPVLSIPTHRPVARQDLDDEIFRTFDQKVKAIVKQVQECVKRKQPVLVGTASIEKSEVFAKAFAKAGIRCNVLNARQHEREAVIIAEAGSPGAVTIATNMAGRGTDIKLGGNWEMQVAQLLRGDETPEERQALEKRVQDDIERKADIARQGGGLYVLGTERHESRRIDNQLRGRSGRQGDPGQSKFFISLEDDLMRIFGPNMKMMEYALRSHKDEEDTPLTHPWLSRAIEKAQQRVEAQHFETRKHLLKYADVLNIQRTTVYCERDSLMDLDDASAWLQVAVDKTIATMIEGVCEGKKLLPQAGETLAREARRLFAVALEGQDDLLHRAGAQAANAPGAQTATVGHGDYRTQTGSIPGQPAHRGHSAFGQNFDEHGPEKMMDVPGTLDAENSHNPAHADGRTNAHGQVNTDGQSGTDFIQHSQNATSLSSLATPEQMRTHLVQAVKSKQQALQEALGAERFGRLAKTTLLRILDEVWIAHLNAMEHLRSGIHLQAYAQKDPLNEYKHQAFVMFANMLTQWQQEVVASVFHTDPQTVRRLSAVPWHEDSHDDDNQDFQGFQQTYERIQNFLANHKNRAQERLMQEDDRTQAVHMDPQDASDSEDPEWHQEAPDLLREFMAYVKQQEASGSVAQKDEGVPSTSSHQGILGLSGIQEPSSKKNLSADESGEALEGGQPIDNGQDDVFVMSRGNSGSADGLDQKLTHVFSDQEPCQDVPVDSSDDECKDEGATQPASLRPHRLGPCPCGSGKRYKHCCGSL